MEKGRQKGSKGGEPQTEVFTVGPFRALFRTFLFHFPQNCAIYFSVSTLFVPLIEGGKKTKRMAKRPKKGVKRGYCSISIIGSAGVSCDPLSSSLIGSIAYLGDLFGIYRHFLA
jgi:hypothetical protein